MKKYTHAIPSPLTPSADDLCYDAMEFMESRSDDVAPALDMLNQAYALEPLSVLVQINLVHTYVAIDHTVSAHAHIERAYQLTCKHFKKWPKELPWGVLENRPFLRAIHYKGDLLAEQNDTKGALELYKLLLRLNPHDNQGIRYLVAGIYAGMGGEEINDLMDMGNAKQDWSELHKLVEKQNKIHHFWDDRLDGSTDIGGSEH